MASRGRGFGSSRTRVQINCSTCHNPCTVPPGCTKCYRCHRASRASQVSTTSTARTARTPKERCHKCQSIGAPSLHRSSALITDPNTSLKYCSKHAHDHCVSCNSSLSSYFWDSAPTASTNNVGMLCTSCNSKAYHECQFCAFGKANMSKILRGTHQHFKYDSHRTCDEHLDANIGNCSHCNTFDFMSEGMFADLKLCTKCVEIRTSSDKMIDTITNLSEEIDYLKRMFTEHFKIPFPEHDFDFVP